MQRFWRLLPKKERVLLYISWSVKAAILIVLVSSIIRFNILTAGLALMALVISFLPSMILKKFQFILPPEFETLFALFLYATFILGELQGYYTKFLWWDVMIHSFSSIMMALIAFMIIFSFYQAHKVVFAAHFAALFSFTFALGLGALWEIFEFSMDSFFGLNMQRSGLIDTMWDLIMDALGALLVSIIGYFYMKGRPSLLMEKFVKRFIQVNDGRLRRKSADQIL